MLSRLYRYSYLAYVGGGMVKQGVHNVLEAAVFDKPVLMGPHYHKYSEAVGLVNVGGGISFDSAEGLVIHINTLLRDPEEYSKRSKAAGEFVRSQQGATQKILSYIQEKRLLTN
jgi:3-deoxy-D-manno-octulosonic-acid transferase